MPAVMLTAPQAEPIGLADAKAFLRLEHEAEDDLVETLVAAAAREVEALTRRVLVAQRWRLDVAVRPGDVTIELKPRPVREVEQVRMRAYDGTLAVLDEDAWRFDWAAERLILLKPPVTRGVLEIDLAVGYGPPEEVPESLRLAVRRLTAANFERRTPGEGPPPDVSLLVAPYRDFSL